MIKKIIFFGIILLMFLAAMNLRNQRKEVDEKLLLRDIEVEETAEANEVAEVSQETGEVVEFELRASNFKFDLSEMRVKEGDRVKINLINDGGEHDLVIDELEVKSKILTDNESEVIEFVASKKGTFEYYCSVGQHRQMGMMGNLIVE